MQQQAGYAAITGASIPWPDLVATAVRTSVVWMVLSFGVFELVQWLMAARVRPLGLVLAHLAGLFGANAIDVGADTAYFRLVGRAGWDMGFTAGFLFQFLSNALFYGAVAGLVTAAMFWGLARERRVESALLEAQLSRARLVALTMQLQPHFIFNTLHAVTAVVYDRPADAERMLVRLADLLRATAEDLGRQCWSLAEELELTEAYLDIERIRFEGRLDVNIDVPDDLRCATVPTLILQPLLENAIKYGVAKQIGPGRVGLQARRQGEFLGVSVTNLATAASQPARAGIGLANTRERLDRLYRGAATLSLTGTETGEVTALVTIPLRVGLHVGDCEEESPATITEPIG